jgi:hypothetical protein
VKKIDFTEVAAAGAVRTFFGMLDIKRFKLSIGFNAMPSSLSPLP